MKDERAIEVIEEVKKEIEENEEERKKLYALISAEFALKAKMYYEHYAFSENLIVKGPSGEMPLCLLFMNALDNDYEISSDEELERICKESEGWEL